jgi:hypothetical protein
MYDKIAEEWIRQVYAPSRYWDLDVEIHAIKNWTRWFVQFRNQKGRYPNSPNELYRWFEKEIWSK